jgi:hypothetical protein
VTLKPRTHQNGKFGVRSVCVIVQSHNAQHPLGSLVEGDEGHCVGRIVVDEFVEQGGKFTSRIGAKKRSRKSSLLTSLRKSGYKPASSTTSGRIRTGVPSGRRTWCSVNETSALVGYGTKDTTGDAPKYEFAKPGRSHLSLPKIPSDLGFA